MRRTFLVASVILVGAACGLDVVGTASQETTAGPDAAPSSSSTSTSSSSSSSSGDATVPEPDLICQGSPDVPPTAVAHLGSRTVDGQGTDWPCDERFEVKSSNAAGHGAMGVPTSRLQYSVAWDITGFYVMAHVFTVAPPSGDSPENYDNDAVEIYLGAPRPTDPHDGAFEDHDVQLIVDHLGVAKTYRNLVGSDAADSRIQAAATERADGYIIEAFIPKSVVNVDDMTKTHDFAFEIQVDEPAGDGTRPDYWIYSTTDPFGNDTCGADRIREPACDSTLWGPLQTVSN